MGEADAQRTIWHHMAVCDAHPGRPVHTVVFWGRRKSPKQLLQSGDPSLAIEEVLLARHQAWDATMAAVGDPLAPSRASQLSLAGVTENPHGPTTSDRLGE